MSGEPDFDELLETMKKAAGALRDAEIPHALTGGLAVWARGGAKTEHDVDFLVKEEDAERAQRALADIGMRPETPPEGWLLKAWDGDRMVDLIYEPAGGPIDDDWLARAEVMDVYATTMPVAALEDVLVTKLLALNEQELDYSSVLETARSVREQVDWDEVRSRTAESPYAAAFFTLIEKLGVVDETGSATPR
jgi:Aminoglycoside-2''-adenylyltransferase